MTYPAVYRTHHSRDSLAPDVKRDVRVVAHACNLAAQEAEAEESQIQGYPGQLSETLISKQKFKKG